MRFWKWTNYTHIYIEGKVKITQKLRETWCNSRPSSQRERERERNIYKLKWGLIITLANWIVIIFLARPLLFLLFKHSIYNWSRFQLLHRKLVSISEQLFCVDFGRPDNGFRLPNQLFQLFIIIKCASPIPPTLSWASSHENDVSLWYVWDFLRYNYFRLVYICLAYMPVCEIWERLVWDISSLHISFWNLHMHSSSNVLQSYLYIYVQNCVTYICIPTRHTPRVNLLLYKERIIEKR